MKRYFIFMAIIFGMIAPSVSAQTAKQKVAVYVTGDTEAGYKKVIGSKLVTGITRSEGYAAVERTADFLAELTKEQDYQMSGAVSDNQIARLGQQFGVRYVLVADISEVFESMFISARMIDVQTAQITNSTESDAVVDDMNSLSKIAESIVVQLFFAKEYADDEIKVIGPFSTVKELWDGSGRYNVDYHIATIDEIDKIIKANQLLDDKTYFPIYADITKSTQFFDQYYTAYYGRSSENEDRFYDVNTIGCVLIEKNGSISKLSLSYSDDYFYISQLKLLGGIRTSGLYSMANNPSITPGYVYVVKNK